jgi:hypothetical protein
MEPNPEQTTDPYQNPDHPLRQQEKQWLLTGTADKKIIKPFLKQKNNMFQRLAKVLLDLTENRETDDPMALNLKKRRNFLLLNSLTEQSPPHTIRGNATTSKPKLAKKVGTLGPDDYVHETGENSHDVLMAANNLKIRLDVITKARKTNRKHRV